MDTAENGSKYFPVEAGTASSSCPIPFWPFPAISDALIDFS